MTQLPPYNHKYFMFGAERCATLTYLEPITHYVPQELCPELHLRMSTGQPRLVWSALQTLLETTAVTVDIACVESLRLAVVSMRTWVLDPVYLTKLSNTINQLITRP